MRKLFWIIFCAALTALIVSLSAGDVGARNPIRNAFFTVYPGAENTQLDDLPSNAGHCGVCHFDFDGGGPRNPYGAAIEVARNSGLYADDEEAIAAIEMTDHDFDSFSSYIEITSGSFTNTPTFPGLMLGDTAAVMNVSIADIVPYLEPAGSTDSIPPAVTVLSPNGAEDWTAHTTQAVTWTASDASGISLVDIYMSDDNGATFKPIARNEPDDGTFDWFVPNLPGGQTIIRVRARDAAGNYGADWSDGVFTVTGLGPGIVPTTLRDMQLPGTQPLTGVVLEDPDANCRTCHGDYDTTAEPWYVWKGSMMAQAQRDPLFLACLTVAEQDAPSVGDLCLRCHTPGGWMEGRSVDTGGGLINAKDRQGVQCDFCHRLVDPIHDPGIDPPEDQLVLDSLTTTPLSVANGQFVASPNPPKRGPYADADASHAFIESPFHRVSDQCGTCHDVSNPVFVLDGAPGVYAPNAFDAEHPDGDLRNMFPIERTYSEWSMSEYATSGVFAPQFAGNLPSGIVSSCQDCHMRDVSGKGCNEPGAPTRNDLGMHDLTGGNTFVPDILPDFYPGEVDVARLQAGKQRAIDMLQLAATLALESGQVGLDPTVTVTVTNEGAHKLPSGYPEGRRVWVNVKAYDESDVLVYESGAYDDATGVLTHDEDAKIYEIKPGISTRLSPIVGLPVGPSFHFVINDTIFSDNRIPPRGFTNANFETIQSPPVAHTYADGQYWDETEYTLPQETAYAVVTVYYQTTSKEYIEFLRDENVTNSAGIDLYNAWVAHGKNPPVAMATDTVDVEVDVSGPGDVSYAVTDLKPNFPNPFNPSTAIRYSLSERQRVRIDVFDVTGRKVKTLVDDVRPAGVQKVMWYGTNAYEEPVASGIYMIRMVTADGTWVRKATLLK